MNVTNRNGISLEMAVWLLYDEYDFIDEPNYISATALLKPIRHILLPPRVPEEQRIEPDVEDFVSRALGSTIHAGIEKAWKQGNHRRALKLLGYPESVAARILVNPAAEDLARVEDPIPIYIEQRAFRQLDGYTIGGKFDMIAEGGLRDVKTTTAYSWLYGGKDEDYRLQGSIYRWLNQDKVTEDYIRINFVFTDWKKMDAVANPAYPQSRILHKDIPLLTIAETEAWIRHKLAQLERHKNTPEAELPECTPEELWMTEPKYKYFADPMKITGRSTRNFDDPVEARKFAAEKGKGTIVTVPGEPKRCAYCLAFPICSQRKKMLPNED